MTGVTTKLNKVRSRLSSIEAFQYMTAAIFIIPYLLGTVLITNTRTHITFNHFSPLPPTIRFSVKLFLNLMKNKKIFCIKWRTSAQPPATHDSRHKIKPCIAGIDITSGCSVSNRAVTKPKRNVKCTDNIRTVSVPVHGWRIGTRQEKKVPLWV